MQSNLRTLKPQKQPQNEQKKQQPKKQKTERKQVKIVFDVPFDYKIECLNQSDSSNFINIFNNYITRNMSKIKVGRRQFIRKLKNKEKPNFVVIFFNPELYETFEDVFYHIQNDNIEYILINHQYCDQIRNKFKQKRINILSIYDDEDISEFKGFLFKSDFRIENIIDLNVLKELKVLEQDVTRKKNKQE